MSSLCCSYSCNGLSGWLWLGEVVVTTIVIITAGTHRTLTVSTKLVSQQRFLGLTWWTQTKGKNVSVIIWAAGRASMAAVVVVKVMVIGIINACVIKAMPGNDKAMALIWYQIFVPTSRDVPWELPKLGSFHYISAPFKIFCLLFLPCHPLQCWQDQFDHWSIVAHQ